MKKDIETLEDIRVLVDTLYTNVQKDTLIGGIFMGVIKDWPLHLGKMYRFWQTLLLEEHTYEGKPFLPHATMPVEKKHFDRWLQLWEQAVDMYFEGPKADEAKWRGQRMAAMFLSKIEFIRAHPGQIIL